MATYLLPIVGIIGEEYTYLDLLLHLKNAQDYDSIKLLINSDGGFVDEGYKMREALLNCGKTIYATNTGNIASMAVSLFLTAQKQNRTFDPSKGVFHPHNPWTGAEGDADYLSAISKELKKTESLIEQQYSEATGTSVELLSAFLAEDIDLTPDQIEGLGFATIIKPEFKAVAFYNKHENKMQKEEVEKRFSAIEKTIAGFKALFRAKCLLLQDVNGVELDFGAEITDPSLIVVGSAVTANGEPANGDYTMPDGTILVCQAGLITEIKPSMPDESEEMKKEIEQLKAELEAERAKVNEAQSLVDQSKSQFAVLESEFKSFRAQYSKDNERGQNVPSNKTEKRKSFNI